MSLITSNEIYSMVNKSIEVEVQKRIDCILNDPQLLKIHKKFGGLVFRRSSAIDWFEKFLIEAEVGSECHPDKNCVEIGTRHGLTAIILSRFFKHVYSFDIVDSNLKERIVKYLNIENITYYTVEDNKEKAEIIKGLDFQCAYVDGDHEKDTLFDFRLVRKCRNVIFHEAVTNGEVKKLLARLDNVCQIGNHAYWRG